MQFFVQNQTQQQYFRHKQLKTQIIINAVIITIKLQGQYLLNLIIHLIREFTMKNVLSQQLLKYILYAKQKKQLKMSKRIPFRNVNYKQILLQIHSGNLNRRFSPQRIICYKKQIEQSIFIRNGQKNRTLLKLSQMTQINIETQQIINQIKTFNNTKINILDENIIIFLQFEQIKTTVEIFQNSKQLQQQLTPDNYYYSLQNIQQNQKIDQNLCSIQHPYYYAVAINKEKDIIVTSSNQLLGIFQLNQGTMK
ncbi:unnamed protein product [Paramecium primaurelia]|uniref:Uncharacterized protein n=1 Tax=Paramecium primaurelia TaxID=5886 RepID=A0A8S1QP39_PARPR|nr:unnamed protein product [Paramecium primaurelia]